MVEPRAPSIARLLLIGVLIGTTASAGLATAVTAAPGAVPTHAQESGGPVEIDSCTTIDEPGRYVLTEDIEDSEEAVCIDILSDDVHLDGNGHLVDGNLSRETIEAAADGPAPRTRVGVGVNVRTDERVENVTVKDVTVTDWFHGVLSENVSGGTTTDVTAYANGGGVIYDNSSGVTVSESNTSNNVILGIIVDSRRGVTNADNRVVDNTATNNGIHGVAIALSNNSTIADNTLSGNLFGIFSYGTVDTTFEDNDARENTVGLSFYGELDPSGDASVGASLDAVEPRVSEVNVSRRNVVVDNDFSESGYNGIVVDSTSKTYFEDNDVSDVAGTGPFPSYYAIAGMVFNESSDNVVVDSDATGVNGSGFVLGNSSDGNAFVGNNASENADDGFAIDGSEDVVLIRNTVTDNGDDGIDIVDSERVLLLFNDVSGNDDEAVEVTSSEGVVRLDAVGDSGNENESEGR